MREPCSACASVRVIPPCTHASSKVCAERKSIIAPIDPRIDPESSVPVARVLQSRAFSTMCTCIIHGTAPTRRWLAASGRSWLPATAPATASATTVMQVRGPRQLGDGPVPQREASALRALALAMNHPITCSDWWGPIALEALKAEGTSKRATTTTHYHKHHRKFLPPTAASARACSPLLLSSSRLILSSPLHLFRSLHSAGLPYEKWDVALLQKYRPDPDADQQVLIALSV